jgi:hypothetical protein
MLKTWLIRRGPALEHHLVSECVWFGSTLGMVTDGRPQRTLLRLNSGWPFPALAYSMMDDTTSTKTDNLWDFGLSPPMRHAFAAHLTGDPRRLPLRPLPLLFAADVVIWGLGALLVSALFTLIRRAWRTRRGCCPACGYPASRAAACPECGSPFPARRTAMDRTGPKLSA